MVKPLSPDDVVLPALLRAARASYANAVRHALVEAGYSDMPKNGAYVVGAISRAGAPLSEIIRGLGVSKQAAGQLIEALVIRDYLDRTVDEDDRRRVTMTLTERGKAAAAVSRKATELVDTKLRKRMDEKSIAEARKVLFALIAIAMEGEHP